MAKTVTNSIWVVFFLALSLGVTPVPAQEPSDSAPEAAAEEDEPEAEAEEELPEIDVWAEDADADDDVFIPTESISADSSIAFPADI